ncbi:unnamed protein product [Phytophthora lilii]|uniref:Clustered mitochondria protein homolog n=1 Tax=Phytophthora lilii TaxID=2077276 RepID=A0A9W6TMR0_9STRA|nr:unnamed protein product [Phytophthora lilii]
MEVVRTSNAFNVQDAIGAIGIARCFTYGGHKLRPLYDPDVPPIDDMTKDQYMDPSRPNTTINHFYEVPWYIIAVAADSIKLTSHYYLTNDTETAQAPRHDEDQCREASGRGTARVHGDVPRSVPQGDQRPRVDSLVSTLTKRLAFEQLQKTSTRAQPTARLSRWPPQLAPTEKVQVQMEHGLAAVLPVVDDDAEALVQVLLLGDQLGGVKQVAQDGLVALLGVRELREAVALLGDEQDVHGRLRVHVVEGQALLVLVRDLGGDLPVDDLVEDGLAHGGGGTRGSRGVGLGAFVGAGTHGSAREGGERAALQRGSGRHEAAAKSSDEHADPEWCAAHHVQDDQLSPVLPDLIQFQGDRARLQASAAASPSKPLPPSCLTRRALAPHVATHLALAQIATRAPQRKQILPMGSSDTAEPTQQPAPPQEEEAAFSLLVAPPAGKGQTPVRLESVSPADTVVTLRQLVAEFPALACYTCYHLEARSLADGSWQPLNDFVELGEYEDVADGATLRMVLDKYDARKVRAHVRRLRDVLSNPPIPQAAAEPEAQPEAVADAAQSEDLAEGEQLDEKKLKEISEQQLKRLREIHHKLEGIEVPVKPELAEFYVLPGAATTTEQEAEQTEQTPVKSKDQKKGKKGKKNQHKQKQQQIEANEQKEQEKQQDAKLPACVKSIVFSGYNPPPGPRKLAGDLLYLEVVVAGDNTRYHITAHVNGFFVNRSTATKFDPRPHKTAAAHSHLLLDVLSTVSPKFRESYTALLAKAASLAKEGPSSIEWMMAAGSNVGGKLPWNTPAASATEEHTYDLNRAEDELCSSFGMDERGVLRDWNEEYQCCRELPTTSLKEEIVRARVTYKIVTEFVEAATQGAVAIVEGHIPPINPMDDKNAHVYVFNNIFFSVSIDGKSTKDAAGGEENAYSAANRDLQGVKALNEADVDGLHTLATTVVDYLGVRVIAQSLIPGILMGDAASKLVYGSVDHGKTIAANSDMHELMLLAGEKLHIAERSIKPLGKSEEDLAAEKEQESLGVPPPSGGEASTEVATICGAVEAKGIQGSDGRLYVLDLVRITPKDWTFYKNRETAEKANEKAPESDGLCFTRNDEGYAALLRPELVQLYSLWKQNQARRANEEARKAAKDAKKAEDAKQKKESEAKTSDDGAQKTDNTETEEETEENGQVEEEIPPVLLNPNVFMEYAASTDAKQLEADEAAAKDAAEYLQKIVVPAFVADVRRGSIAPADGYALTQVMHSCGINMRYLGRLASLSKKLEAINGISKYLLELLEVEMISRAAKHILADVLNSNDSIRAAPGSAIVKLLNGILGSISAVNKEVVTEVNGSDDTATTTTASLDAKTLWARIEKEVKARFDYKLSLWGPGRDDPQRDGISLLGRVHKTVLLRRLCQRLGLRVVSRNYDFSSPCAAPISLDDITGVVPVVKSSLPAHPLAPAKQLLERGRMSLSQGALSSSYESLQEASSLLFQVCGAAHEDAALCSSSLATVLYHAGDVVGAIAQQQRALALYTQLQGIDYHDTAYAHANLALFLHANAQTELAVPHMRRAIYLLELCCGPHFPEISTLYFKMGMMCQDVGQITLALTCHRESLRRGEFDRNQAANTLHQMALACGLAGGYREALAYEKKVYSLFKEAYGDEDPRVIESAKFMARFTEKAVEGAKGRREVDAAAAADAIANELLGELEFKTEPTQDAGSPPAAKKKNKKTKSGNKKH